MNTHSLIFLIQIRGEIAEIWRREYGGKLEIRGKTLGKEESELI